MKKIAFIFFIACSFLAIGQSAVVRDISSREPIENAVIADKKNVSVITNSKGRADFSTLDVSDSVWVTHIGYNPVKVMLGGEGTTVNLSPKLFQLDEIVFSANRSAEKKIDVPYSMEIIKQRNIEFANQPTTADLLQNTGAIFVQKSQLGGGSPVLRGFEANKVLIVVDGVRMNNAIYRGGHLQDIITLDANMLERAEVIFGPASTIYGSDALGGVMHFYTKNAQFANDDKMLFKLNAMVREATVNEELTTHIDFNLGFKNFASMTNITYSDFGDLMSGSTKLEGSAKAWDRTYYAKRFGDRDSMVKNENDNLQVGTAYNQVDLMQRFSLKTGDHLLHNLNLQYSTSSDIPRYDRLTEMSGTTLKFAEWYYGPQNRFLGAYTLNYDGKTFFTDNIKLILAYQNIEQNRITRRFGKTERISQMENVTVLSANVDLFKRFMVKHEVRYGIEITGNDVVSSADATDIITNSVTPAATRYADGGNKMNTFSAYYSYSWEVNENFVITDGIRYTYNTLKSVFNDTTFKLPFKVAQQNNQALTANLGFTWKADNDYKVSILGNTGFRTPNIDDMSKVFESGGGIVIVPNADIKPEYAYNMEMGISKIFEGKYKFDITGFYTMLENALVLKDFTFNGNDSLLFNGTNSKVQAMQNADRAYIYGFSAGIQFDFNKHISVKSIINYTYGRYNSVANDTVVPLDHIPPVFGQTNLIYKARNTDIEFFVRYNGKKATADYSSSGEDNKAYSADPVNGYMPSWFTLNIRGGYSITKRIRINVACENITDNRYRVFASGINAPGRNFIISLRFKI
jgi:hemoglobin/transferrin/lactoferrin receptor protein